MSELSDHTAPSNATQPVDTTSLPTAGEDCLLRSDDAACTSQLEDCSKRQLIEQKSPFDDHMAGLQLTVPNQKLLELHHRQGVIKHMRCFSPFMHRFRR